MPRPTEAPCWRCSRRAWRPLTRWASGEPKRTLTLTLGLALARNLAMARTLARTRAITCILPLTRWAEAHTPFYGVNLGGWLLTERYVSKLVS